MLQSLEKRSGQVVFVYKDEEVTAACAMRSRLRCSSPCRQTQSFAPHAGGHRRCGDVYGYTVGGSTLCYLDSIFGLDNPLLSDFASKQFDPLTHLHGATLGQACQDGTNQYCVVFLWEAILPDSD
jgi:hypothetical protein